MMKFPAKITKFLGSEGMVLFIKWAVLVTAVGFIYLKLNGLNMFFANSNVLFSQSWSYRPEGIVIVLLLLPANYILETLKWKWLLRKLINITVWHGLKAVLSGLTLGFITPLSLGDFAGRILFLPSHIRLSTIFPLVLGRFAQFVITVFFGCIAVVFTFIQDIDMQWFDWNMFFLIVPLSLLVPVLMYSNRKFIWQILQKWLPIPWVNQVHQGAELFDAYEFLITCLIGSSRYFIFVVQYLAILYFFGFQLSLLLVSGVIMIFLAKSSLPTFNFMNDLGVREMAALFFLGFTGMPDDTIVLASLSLWVINILFPAIFGLVFVQQIKLSTKK